MQARFHKKYNGQEINYKANITHSLTQSLPNELTEGTHSNKISVKLNNNSIVR